MKKSIFIVFLIVFLAIPLTTVAAQERGPFGLDAGANLSTGYVKSSDPLYSGLSALFLFRAGMTVTGRYRINDTFSTGAEIGLAYMSMSADGGTTSTTWIDIPMQAVFRVGGGKTFIEPHIGYYLSASVPAFSGFSMGAKGSLGGFYADFTYVIGSTYKYPRFGIGWQWNNIF